MTMTRLLDLPMKMLAAYIEDGIVTNQLLLCNGIGIPDFLSFTSMKISFPDLAM